MSSETTTAPEIASQSPMEVDKKVEIPTEEKKVEVPMEEEKTLKRTYSDMKKSNATAVEKGSQKRKKQRKIFFLPPKANEDVVLFRDVDPNDVLDIIDQVNAQKQGPREHATLLEPNQVRIGPTRAEIKAFKKQYTDEYNKRPETVEKKEKKKNSEEHKKRRRDYAAREDVKLRKKLRAKEGRMFKKYAKTLNPNIHDELMNKVRKDLIGESSSESSEEPSSSEDGSEIENNPFVGGTDASSAPAPKTVETSEVSTSV
jgi:hypothetical protein